MESYYTTIPQPRERQKWGEEGEEGSGKRASMSERSCVFLPVASSVFPVPLNKSHKAFPRGLVSILTHSAETMYLEAGSAV